MRKKTKYKQIEVPKLMQTLQARLKSWQTGHASGTQDFEYSWEDDGNYSCH